MTVYPSSTFPPPTQVTVAIIGAVVAAVVVLVGGSVVVAASLIAWKVRSTKASTGMHCTVVHICLCYIYSKTYNVTQSIFSIVGAQVSPPKVSTVVTMQDKPSYRTVEGGPIIQPNPAYMKTSSE